MKDLFSDEPATNYQSTASTASEAEDNLYPVLVYVHGEDFAWGAGSLHDGRVLSTYGKVVVVTFNFRLGVLGKNFSAKIQSYKHGGMLQAFSTPTLILAGNLKWPTTV